MGDGWDGKQFTVERLATGIGAVHDQMPYSNNKQEIFINANKIRKQSKGNEADGYRRAS
jgi:hypothetical protein